MVYEFIFICEFVGFRNSLYFKWKNNKYFFWIISFILDYGIKYWDENNDKGIEEEVVIVVLRVFRVIGCVWFIE